MACKQDSPGLQLWAAGQLVIGKQQVQAILQQRTAQQQQQLQVTSTPKFLKSLPTSGPPIFWATKATAKRTPYRKS